MINKYNKVSIGVSLHCLLFCLMSLHFFFHSTFKKWLREILNFCGIYLALSLFMHEEWYFMFLLVKIQSDNIFMTYVIVSLAAITKNHILVA